MTYSEIARALGLSRQMVIYIERRAIAKLRAVIEGRTCRRPPTCSNCGEPGHTRTTCVTSTT